MTNHSNETDDAALSDEKCSRTRQKSFCMKPDFIHRAMKHELARFFWFPG
jgi:hypothetical protein